MAKSENQKLKILYILDYLQKHSSEDKPVSTAELIGMLNAHDIACERKSIYSDLDALTEFGVDIVKIPGRNGGVYIGSREFELPELKLLIDAVQSSRYLTEKKSRELIRKLCRLTGQEDAALLSRDVTVDRRVKSMNETIYYNIDAIQDAISENKQITFRYFDWDIDGSRKYREKPYVASPYGLCQDNENCYLLGHSDRHGITSYRVDRMQDIVLLEQQRTPCPELAGKHFQEHAARLFQMYAGEQVNVKLRFHRSMINAVIDRFGRDTMLIPDGKDHFVFTVPVAVSPIFLSWLMGFGKLATIVYPESVIREYKKLAGQSLRQYYKKKKEQP